MSLIRSKGVFVTTMQGLGDLVVSVGIFKELAKNHSFCIVPVPKSYKLSLKSLIGSSANIHITSYTDSKSNSLMLRQRQVVKALGLNIVDLGFFGENWLKVPNIKFDEQIYNQAGIDFSLRWTSFNPVRDIKKEKELYSRFDIEPGKYAFVHEDSSRGMVIDRSYIDPSLTIIEADPNDKGNSITDYMYLIEHAGEIHTIESSFAALVESMQTDVKKFSHRYAREKVVKNPQIQFTYKSDWVILN